MADEWTERYTKENPFPGWEKGPIYFGPPALLKCNDLERQCFDVCTRWLEAMKIWNSIAADNYSLIEENRRLRADLARMAERFMPLATE